MNFLYGVQFEPETASISAGVIRKAGDQDIFITKCDVTQQTMAAAAVWLLVHHGNAPVRIDGTYYELTAKVVT